MKNYVQLGDNLTLPAPYAVASGGGMKVGSIVGVASTDAAQGEDVSCVRVGVFNMPKPASQAWAVGVKLYWDDTARNVTSTVGSNTLIGAAAAAVGGGAGETTGSVLFTGQIA